MPGTFRQAQTHLGPLLSSLEQQTFVPPAKQNLREFLAVLVRHDCIPEGQRCNPQELSRAAQGS